MRTKHLIPVILLLCGLMLLSACAPAAPTEEPQQQPAVETPDPDLAPDESQGGSIPYPYPAPQEPQEAIDPYPAPNEVQEAYPGPQEILPVWDPYPSVEIVDDASERDFSEALGPDEFEVLPGDEALISDLVYIEISQINIKDGDPAPVDFIRQPAHTLRPTAGGAF
jgi:hypothetical protein